MITPEYLNEIMYGVEDKLADVNEYLLRRIIKRIMTTFENGEGNLFIPATIDDMHKLMQNGVLYEDIQKAIEKALPEISKEIKQAFYESGAEISRQNLDIAKKIVDIVGLSSVSVPEWEQVGITQKASELGMTKLEIAQLEAAYRRTNGEIKNLTRTTANKAQEKYINACDNAYMKAKSGVSVQTAVVEAIKEVADKGIECVSYGGKTDKIEVAIARAVRTGVNQANGDIALTRCAEMGVEYVKTSSHLGARVTATNDYTNHSWWQGKVFSIDWNTEEMQEFIKSIKVGEQGFEWLDKMREEMQKQKKYSYPDFVKTTGYGTLLGLCGVNCRHSFYQFYPGIQLNDDDKPNMDENEKRYHLDQKQRAMERAMRQTKRELDAIKAANRNDKEFKEEKKKLTDKLYGQSDKYMQFCQDNNLRDCKKLCVN